MQLLLLSLPYFVLLSWSQVCASASASASNDDVHFQYKAVLDQWAVKIDGGVQKCHEIADSFALDCTGTVGSLEDTYLLRRAESSGPLVVRGKRSIIEDVTETLKSHGSVISVSQQFLMQRFKREPEKPPTPAVPNFNDPWFDKQWYIQGSPEHSLHILQAWQRKYTGKGVTVAIVDDGVDRNHPDLVGNFDFQNSVDLADNDTDPTPLNATFDGHGTRCAGEIAAVANNSECTVGVAYSAKLAGIRVPLENTTDATEATSLSYNRQHIDIYSNSWGPPDNGAAMDRPYELTLRALAEGVEKGRNGRGSIFVWASGNGGENDSCSCDGYASSIYAIGVGAVDYNDSVPLYAEACPSKLISTYSSGFNHSMATTNAGGTCTMGFGATSAAAPIASAIYALVLEANPNLSWRDVKYISVLGADDTACRNSDWEKNGVGRRYSTQCGYGLMDADAMTRLAELWLTLPQQHICSTEYFNGSLFIPGGLWTTTLATDACIATEKHVRFVEHVVLTLSVSVPIRGDMKITLVSPRGTRCALLTFRPRDNNTSFEDWPFMSVQFWGEPAAGQWTVEIYNKDTSSVGNLTAMQLTVYGTDVEPIRLKEEARAALLRRTNHRLDFTRTGYIINERVDRILPLYFAEYDSYSGACDSQCSDGCAGPTAFDCRDCKHAIVLHDQVLQCVPQCPPCTYAADSQTSNATLCVPCDQFCSSPLNCVAKQHSLNLNKLVVSCIVVLALLSTFSMLIAGCIRWLRKNRPYKRRRVHKNHKLYSRLIQEEREDREDESEDNRRRSTVDL